MCVSVQLAAWLVISHNVDFNYFNCMQYMQFTLCFASCAPLLVRFRSGKFAFFSLARRKFNEMKIANCMHFVVAVVAMENLLKCCCLRWMVKFCGSNGAYDWRVWRLAGKLICILFKWIVWFLLLCKAATTLLNISSTLSFYFLLNLFRYEDIYMHINVACSRLLFSFAQVW